MIAPRFQFPYFQFPGIPFRGTSAQIAYGGRVAFATFVPLYADKGLRNAVDFAWNARVLSVVNRRTTGSPYDWNESGNIVDPRIPPRRIECLGQPDYGVTRAFAPGFDYSGLSHCPTIQEIVFDTDRDCYVLCVFCGPNFVQRSYSPGPHEFVYSLNLPPCMTPLLAGWGPEYWDWEDSEYLPASGEFTMTLESYTYP